VAIVVAGQQPAPVFVKQVLGVISRACRGGDVIILMLCDPARPAYLFYSSTFFGRVAGNQKIAGAAGPDSGNNRSLPYRYREGKWFRDGPEPVLTVPARSHEKR
jgi:hypothetical protein